MRDLLLCNFVGSWLAYKTAGEDTERGLAAIFICNLSFSRSYLAGQRGMSSQCRGAG